MQFDMESRIRRQPHDAPVAELIRRAFDACAHSYSPYSNFPVGAALLCADGTIYTGCNVENAAYSMGVCAERTAIVKAVSDGRRAFKAIAVCAPKYQDFISPCGACRQTMTEFGSDWTVYMCRGVDEYVELSTGELMPMCFTPDEFRRSVDQ